MNITTRVQFTTARAEREQGAGSTDTLSIVTSRGLRLTKQWRQDGSIDSYQDAKYCKLEQRAVSGIHQLSALLSELETRPTTCLLRGKFVGVDRARELDLWEFELGWVRKTLHYFEDQPLHVMLIDVDGFAPLASDALEEPLEAIDEFIATRLPEEFRGVSFHWQLSASAGHPSKGNELRVHLWFWLRDAATSSLLQAWATQKEVACDKALFQPVQLHYTAAPVFDAGVEDPIGQRSGFVQRDSDSVDLAPALARCSKSVQEKPRGARLQEVAGSDPILAAIKEEGLFRSTAREGAINILCPFVSEHGSGAGAETSTQYFLPNTNGFPQGSFKCMHATCADRRRDDFLQALGIVVPMSAEELNEEARRAMQVEENRLIGEEGPALPPLAEVVTFEAALARFVFVTDGSRVADIANPRIDLALTDFRNCIAASTSSVPQPPKLGRGGEAKPRPDRIIKVSEQWLDSPDRQTVLTRTFKAGGALTLLDPLGQTALNTWRPFHRMPVEDPEKAGLGLFLEHVQWLFGNDAERFLDWLAHIEQRPGELPHTAWLHIAQHFGLGRNWLGSVLTRVWAGAVAANVNFRQLMGSEFNGRLSRKILAFVDEIREGGRDSHWDHGEKLKSLITEEQRLINPKFGRQSVEFNSCRWVFFSNHLTAIPIEQDDRRLEVVHTDERPRAAEYYTELYSALKRPAFIEAVASFLSTRNILNFNPGAKAKLTGAKESVMSASMSPAAQTAKLIADFWPCDVAPTAALAQTFDDPGFGDPGFASTTLQNGQRRSLEQFGVRSLGKQVKVDGKPTRFWVIRGWERWSKAQGVDLAAEWKRGQVEFGPERFADFLADRGAVTQ